MSFLMRLLQTTGLSLALVTASAAGVHAEDVIVQGSGGGGDSVTADAGSLTPNNSPLNNATAIGENGENNYAEYGIAGYGGSGGAATATAATTIISGSAGADAVATGGNGGASGFNYSPSAPYFTNGGSGGTATASAKGSTGNGNATVSASATGGNGGVGDDQGGLGGDANANSIAKTAGGGDASSSASATAGTGGGSFDSITADGNATATAAASAGGGGKAIATAVATSSGGSGFNPEFGNANATSTAITVDGALAQAQSMATGLSYETQSTAGTSFGGVTFQSTAGGPSESSAIAHGNSASAQGGAFDEASSISTALPDRAYATTLIGDASNVADALLGPRDKVLGTAVLQLTYGDTDGSTFDFRDLGDLLVGVIDASNFSIFANGMEILDGGSVNDSVINLGSNFGPNIDLTISGEGTFVIGGAVPEPSTWAMMMLGFAGLGYVGYRRAREGLRLSRR